MEARKEWRMRRVVVTGLGMVTPLACGVEPTWQRLVKGDSGARRIETFDVSDLPAKIACQVPRGDGSDGSFNPDQWMEPKEQRKVDDFIIFAMCAARQALEDAGWKPASPEDQNSTGVMIGSGIGGLTGIAETAVVLKERGPRRVSPFFIPGRLINLASGYVSIAHGQGTQPRGGDRLFDRSARHRGCRPTGGARRRGGHGGGRRRVADLADRNGRVRRLSRAVDVVQRHAGTRVPSIRPRPGRLRDG